MTPDDRLRVFHFVQDVSDGGIESLLVDLFHETADGIDHHVGYVSDHAEGVAELEAAGGTVARIDLPFDSPRAAFDPRSYPPVVRYLRRNHVDVVHVHFPLYPHVIGRIAGSLAGVDRVVSTHHNDPADFHPIMRGLEWITRPLSDGVVAVSDATRERYTTPVDRLLAGTWTVSTVTDGIDTDGFRSRVAAADGTATRKRWEIDEDATVYLSVGRYAVQKAQLDQIAAMEDVRDEVPNAHLVLVGHGPYRSTLEEAVAARGLADHVTITGRIPHESIPRWYAAADVFTLSSTAEGLGIALLEAMAAGLPIVATAVAGPKEVVVDGETGYLVPPGSPSAFAAAMIDVAEPSRRDRFGRRGHRRAAERFDISTVADRYLALYTGRPTSPTGRPRSPADA